jgi:hypothetical protein
VAESLLRLPIERSANAPPEDFAGIDANCCLRIARQIPELRHLGGCSPSAEFGPNRGKNEERVLDSERR